ncbi:MAG: 2Fe-2S iron-sulfur cluster-binding protein [Halobacteriales archaeon]
MPDDRCEFVYVTVVEGGHEHVLTAPVGTNLRELLLDHGLSPYTRYTERLNCGGRGLCGTCGVQITVGTHPPEHWHDQVAERFGYPRLSCQIHIERDLTVRISEKRIWGDRQRDSDETG